MNDSRIAIKTIVISPKKISIGKRTIINEGCFLDGRGGLIIGNDVSISVASKIITASHKSSSSTFEYKQVKQLLKIMYGLESVQ